MNLSRRNMLLLGASAMALTGCDINRIAGSDVDEGGFGNATMQNQQVHNGEIQVLQDLSGRFQSEVPTTVNFAFNSARVDAAAAQVLRQQAAFMRKYPAVRFSVYGHTDAVGSDAYNQKLGERRARAAVRFLSQNGVSQSRLDALVSLGETQPLVPSGGRERSNRRTETRVEGFVKDHPLILDGNYAQAVYGRYISQ